MKKVYSKILILFVAVFTMLPALTLAQTNQYLHFDREDDFVILNEAGQYVDGTTELSITGWFYCDELAYGQGYMGFRSGTGDGEFYLIQLNDGVMECRLKSTTGLHEYVAPANTAIPQVWQHIAWIFNGTEIILYVNGAMVGSASASGTFSSSTVPFGIGKSLLGGYNFVYGGRIDEVSVWNKALDQSEIQDMIDNELEGNELNLQLYYKFNQGEPGGDNTGITHLVCETGDGERDAELMNFALIGETSNFNGDLDPGYQAISFPQIPNHLISDPAFELEATATSGLEVEFEVLYGPATVEGNICTLTEEHGEVAVQATQPGNGQYDPAEPVVNTFMAIDPEINVPQIDVRNPLEGDLYAPTLDYIQLAAIVTIDYPELFSFSDVQFSIGGQTLEPSDWGDGYFSGWWPATSYGSHTLAVSATNNFGATTTEYVDINIVIEYNDQSAQAVDGVWLNTAVNTIVVEAELPSYVGAFSQVVGTLDVSCPPEGGCGEWDRVASIDARGHDGQWVEIIRYITPYGTPCSHTIDLTDYMSLLQGRVSFRVNCGTLDNGYLYDLTIDYASGSPAHNFSNIGIIWWDTYQFGDYTNLQPVEDVNYTFPDNSEAAKLKLVSTGHGWGDLNTGNAAEFYEATHHIWVNNQETFEQHNWYDCNPNPDGCQPQNGTWYHNRAGWCPGAIAQWFDYDMTSYISEGTIEMGYVFFEDYVDFCHPNHPDCVTGVTCDDCDDGFNPHLIVACNLVSFSDVPNDGGAMVSVDENFTLLDSYIQLYPNPSNGLMTLEFKGIADFDKAVVKVVDLTGSPLRQFEWYGETTVLDLSGLSRGVYFVKINIDGRTQVRKVMIQ